MKNKGITLISLVITIILLIILAGVGINLAIGENGLFNKAKYAKEKYLNASDEEQKQLNELYEELGLLGDLPENTKETEAGTIVRIPNGWQTTIPTYVSDKDGKEVVTSKKIASVYAVSAGNGNTIPVPLDFYYVGGTLESGIVISDSKEDKNKYAGQEYPQIRKYNGFYIGRYEAGVGTLNKNKKENGTDEEKRDPFDYSVTFDGDASLFNSAVAIQTGISGWTWQNYDFTARREGTPVTTGINKVSGNVVVKADSIPYYHADYYTAVEMSERLYSEHQYVKSGLVTGTQWDMMMKYIQNNGIDITASNCGNYDNVSLTNLSGYYTNITSTGATDGFKSCENLSVTNSETNSWILLTTGSTEQVKKMNLYDVAGNLWEWTQEGAYVNSFNYSNNATYNTYVLRGGSFNSTYASNPTCFRSYDYAPMTSTYCGFRIALYLQ